MASLILDNVHFSYPIFEVGARSLKVSLFNQVTGGRVASNAGHVRVDALQGITARFGDGDRVALVGRNGSGKTTLLRLLAGLASPQKGSIAATGRVVPLITTGLGINPELSGEANIELPLRLLGANNAEVRHAMTEIPEFTGLGKFIKMPVRTYSEGMKARLNFAIATSLHADILILDEWLGAGDADFQDKAQKRLKEMVDRAGVLVITSHSMQLLRDVCNKAIWIDRGIQVMTGEINPVIDSYLASSTLTSFAAE